MAISYINGSAIVGANHPLNYTDNKNAAAQYIYAQYIVDHLDTCRHDRTYQLAGEIDTYIGNATARTITLSNSNLVPKVLEIWCNDASYVPAMSLSTFGDGYFAERIDNERLTGIITSLSQGQFVISDAVNVNNSGTTYYYLVLGVDNTSSFTGTPASGSEPDWVEDGENMLGDGTKTSVVNQVEGHLEDNFLVEHLDAGDHNPHPFAGKGKIDLVSWQGDGSATQTITLNDTSITIKDLEIFRDANTVDTVTRLASMSSNDKKIEEVVSYDTGTLTLSTGQFVTNLTTNGRDYYAFIVGE